jgi:hypothetical protein
MYFRLAWEKVRAPETDFPTPDKECFRPQCGCPTRPVLALPWRPTGRAVRAGWEGTTGGLAGALAVRAIWPLLPLRPRPRIAFRAAVGLRQAALVPLFAPPRPPPEPRPSAERPVGL